MLIDYELIGKRIKEERIKNKLTQKDISSKINTSISFYNHIEKGRKSINLKRLAEISYILNKPVGFFLNDSMEREENYLNREFKKILNKCTIKQKKLIYKLAELILEGFL